MSMDYVSFHSVNYVLSSTEISGFKDKRNKVHGLFIAVGKGKKGKIKAKIKTRAWHT